MNVGVILFLRTAQIIIFIMAAYGLLGFIEYKPKNKATLRLMGFCIMILSLVLLICITRFAAYYFSMESTFGG